MTGVETKKGKPGMIKAIHRYFAGIPTVFLDGFIAVHIAVLATMSMYFSTDEAAKYIEAETRFWILLAVGCSLQGLHALSRFRDGTYGRHVEGKRLEAEDVKREQRRTDNE